MSEGWILSSGVFSCKMERVMSMDNLILTFNTVLPVFLVMAVGYLCRQIKLVSDENVRAMNKLVFRLFLPASLAKSIMGVDPATMVSPRVMLFCALGVLALFGVAMAVVPKLTPDNRRRGALVQAMFRSNYAILGIPIAEALFPQGDGGVAAMMVIATVPVFNALAVITLEYFRGGKASLGRMVKGVFMNPLIWGCAIGYVLFKLPFELPVFVQSTISRLASVSSPLALFVLGASIDLKKLAGNSKALLWGSATRLIFVPAVMLTIAFLLGIRGPEFAALMIAFGSPCAVSSYTMAAQMDSDADLAGQLVVLTTVLSALTVFLMIFFFKSVGMF